MKRKFSTAKFNEFHENSNNNHQALKTKNFDDSPSAAAAAATIQIFINYGGRNFTLNIMTNETIENIKLQIMMKTRISIEYQILKYSGSILNDKMTAQSYNIVKESTIFLSIRSFVKKFVFLSPPHVK